MLPIAYNLATPFSMSFQSDSLRGLYVSPSNQNRTTPVCCFAGSNPMFLKTVLLCFMLAFISILIISSQSHKVILLSLNSYKAGNSILRHSTFPQLLVQCRHKNLRISTLLQEDSSASSLTIIRV